MILLLEMNVMKMMKIKNEFVQICPAILFFSTLFLLLHKRRLLLLCLNYHDVVEEVVHRIAHSRLRLRVKGLPGVNHVESPPDTGKANLRPHEARSRALLIDRHVVSLDRFLLPARHLEVSNNIHRTLVLPPGQHLAQLLVLANAHIHIDQVKAVDAITLCGNGPHKGTYMLHGGPTAR